MTWWWALAACAAPGPVATPPAPEEPAVEVAGPVSAPEVAAPLVIDRLLPWDDERDRLTADYVRAHYGDGVPATLDPRVIVLHWTAGPDADSAWNTFAPARLAGRAELAGAGQVNVSAHYLVDRDGTIYRLLSEDRVARHVIGLNHVAIGIENVGGGERWPLTDAQVEANAALVRWIADRRAITHLIGHHEYRSLEGHVYFAELDPAYRTVKPDPGPEFMARVRERVADLGLEPR